MRDELSGVICVIIDMLPPFLLFLNLLKTTSPTLVNIYPGRGIEIFLKGVTKQSRES